MKTKKIQLPYGEPIDLDTYVAKQQPRNRDRAKTHWLSYYQKWEGKKERKLLEKKLEREK